MIPDAWAFVLLALAAYRLTRLIGWDTILDRPRERVVRRAQIAAPNKYRRKVDIFFHCPWCLGFWIALIWWGLWQLWPHGIEVASVPFALSAVVGLVSKNWDP